MEFVKMHGAGNDYVYVDCTKNTIDNPAKLAVKISDRHLGVGSDGLILIKKSECADFFMEMYNADGSLGQMCGNGIRCVGKFVYDFGLTSKTELSIDTPAGVKYLHLNVKDNCVESVRVNMGCPILDEKQIPMAVFLPQFNEAVSNKKSDEDGFISCPVTVNGSVYDITAVSMGNPHAIVYVDDVDSLDLEKIGPCFENCELFPERVNTEFIQVLDRKHLKMRVWERGSGETLACGTGACASLVASVLNNVSDTSAVLELKGGNLFIEWDKNSNTVYMTGPAVTVFTGTYET